MHSKKESTTTSREGSELLSPLKSLYLDGRCEQDQKQGTTTRNNNNKTTKSDGVTSEKNNERTERGGQGGV